MYAHWFLSLPGFPVASILIPASDLNIGLSFSLCVLKQYEKKWELHTHFKRLTHVSC